jgi:prolyl oligopeptidase
MDVEKMTKLQTPNSKEIPNPKQQTTNIRGPGVSALRLGTWNFFGPWSLGFGALAIAALSLTGCITDNSPPDSPSPSLSYPVTRKTNVVDDYNGTKVADPYRWLEDDNSPETKAWVEAQNKITFAYLQSIPELPVIQERLTKLWNYERYGVPVKQGGRYFFTKNDGLQNQSVLFSMPALESQPAVLLDPNKLSADGTVALASYAISNDGDLMAYALSTAGSDWREWRVRDVRTGQDLSDLVKWSRFSTASWTKDGKGFFYSRFDEPQKENEFKGTLFFQKLYYHRLGAPQSEDQLVYHRPDQKEWGFNGGVTDDGRYLIITITHGTDTRNRVFYKDLQEPGGAVIELLNDFDANYTFIDNDGPVFWFHTDLLAPRGRVIAIDTAKPERANWKEIIPQAAETLESVSMINDQFIATYLKDAHSQVKIFSRDGALARELELPAIGTVRGFAGKRSDTETFYSYTSFTVPGTLYRLDLRGGQSVVFREPKVDFDESDYETKQVFYRSKDGTRVPMFITHKHGLKLNGGNPTLLYGYGGFDISLTPGFSVANLVWMEMGGVYAMPNLRGGGEYGEEWHQAGMKLKKQNVFDDFIAAAEWLIANQYTRPHKLAISGASNGGLLVGATLNQRPDLFGAALPAVGVMDMLRFNKFTAGWAWTSDYGSPENPDEFKALSAYSPLQNVKPGTKYPATLITTADHDDRVVPAHSFKYAATLQSAQAAAAPTLIRIETRAGHGAGKPTSKIIEEAAQRWAFLVRELNIKTPWK